MLTGFVTVLIHVVFVMIIFFIIFPKRYVVVLVSGVAVVLVSLFIVYDTMVRIFLLRLYSDDRKSKEVKVWTNL